MFLFDWEKEDHALIRLLFCWGLSWLLVLYWFFAFFQAFLLSMKCIGYNGESLMDTFVWWHKNFHMCCTYSVSASYKALIKFMFEGLLGKSNYSEYVMTCELALPAISDGGLCRRQADGGGTASKSFCPLRLLTSLTLLVNGHGRAKQQDFVYFFSKKWPFSRIGQ